MDKYKIAIVTWITYHNFGTFLQAFALQKVITSLGYENTIISDKKIVESFRNRINLRVFLGKIRRIFCSYSKINNRTDVSLLCYEQFLKQYLVIDDNWTDFKELNNNYDAFICGSDQIWSPNVPFHPFYYLGFTNKKKVAYAPSIGSFDYPENRISLVKPYLKKFSFLSVREIQGEKIIKEKFCLDCQTVLDPTLLLVKADYEELVTKREDKSYILCYLLTYNETYLSFVREYANKKGLELRIFITDFRYIAYADKPLYVGPQEFLNEIRNSTCFFSDSFHGSIFALQFEKDFYIFKRFKDCAKNNQNSRIINLFGKLGLLHRFLSEKELESVGHLDVIDYISVKRLLNKEREISLTYLKTALEK